MIALDDAAMAAVLDAARPLAVRDRDPFLRALAQELAKHGDIGPGLIHRLAADLQRRFFNPPVFHSASKYK